MPHRSTGRLVGVLVLLVLVAVPASAQRMRTERIRFARGASEAPVESRIARGAAVRYLVGARQGQALRVETDRAGDGTQCTFEVYAPGRAIRESNAAPSEVDPETRTRKNRWFGQLSRSGDYQVVMTNRGATGTCGLFVTVE